MREVCREHMSIFLWLPTSAVADSRIAEHDQFQEAVDTPPTWSGMRVRQVGLDQEARCCSEIGTAPARIARRRHVHHRHNAGQVSN